MDEIGTRAEVAAVSTIAQRGVALVASAHGVELRSVLANPDLNNLVGGTQKVILSGGELKSRISSAGQGDGSDASVDRRKGQSERHREPVFTVAIEIVDWNRWKIYKNVAETIDALLGHRIIEWEERWVDQKTNDFYARFTSNARPTGSASAHGKGWMKELIRSLAPPPSSSTAKRS